MGRLQRRCGGGLSAADASLLLLRSSWNLEAAVAAAAADADAVGSAPPSDGGDGGDGDGVPADAVMQEAAEEEGSVCGICFDAPAPPATLGALRCGHAFCTDCWGSLLRVALEKGGAGLHSCCPQPQCNEPLTGEARQAPSAAAPE